MICRRVPSPYPPISTVAVDQGIPPWQSNVKQIRTPFHENLYLDTIKVYSVPSPQDNPARAVPMPSYEEVTQRAESLRALPGLTAAEFQAVLPHFEQAFMTSMDDRTIDGQPRTSRRYT